MLTAVDEVVRAGDPPEAALTGAGFADTTFFGATAFAFVAGFFVAAALDAVLDALFDVLLAAVFETAFAAFFATTFFGFDFAVALLGTLSSGVNERRETTSIDLGSEEVWDGPSQRGRQ